MPNVHTLTVFTDGGARGNPGPAAAAALLYDGVREVQRVSKFLGTRTNNQAEYEAVIIGLEAARALGATVVEVRADSELIVEQLRGRYKVKHPDLAPLFLKAWNGSQSFQRITYTAIPREQNQAADALVNETLNAHT